MEFYQGLTDQELTELDQFLAGEAMPDQAMDTAMLDGFLTALVIGPTTILPSVWLPVVWGETAADSIAHIDAKALERMTNLVFRHLNWIIVQLTEDPDHYEPLLYVSDEEDDPLPIIDEWCSGFVRGIELSASEWAPLTDSEELQAVLTPIYLYGTEDGAETLRTNDDLRARQREFADMLSDCVLAIREFWLPVRKRTTTVRREQSLPGRNDPCMCGSGQKYKKCCGAAGRSN
jgi:uncharacterized protein